MNETPSSYFEQRWRRSNDPWHHDGRWYETRKYDLTAAALPWARYGRIVEAACGTGLLTARLAARADEVTASDRFAAAVDTTARRCAALGNVTAEVRDVRDGPPAGTYDAAVLSEVLYYFSTSAAAAILRAWSGGCSRGGHLAIVHYRPPVPEHVLTGDDVHALASDMLGDPDVHVAEPSFLLDVFVVR